ncbi:sigma-54-dependent Fis family transcriptional regulator [Pseudohalioglobus sediminis]|uniref:Sigma-54-dependent Fis family transcriptional regulator n=1 Tax=Pseudohalioglobus sediminis TaxID=2606449 RepID=A0A5B0WUZ6_9GAMM|nr:sigma-54 dependent transcriptional regulator [Pseudohalioglobus sediminis]KAA1190021.1 sigma-54-dependent Fis family transcriptional regulator [Pseudohalioglobus sediminis]
MHKILVVEDESVIRTALRRLLERSGYQVDEAGSVQQAETEFNFDDYDLIISDLRLPGAPGTDLIQKAGDVPVLIMTSYASLRSAVDSMRMGAVDYIAKPFDHGDMVSAVERIIADHPTARAQQRKATSVSEKSGQAGSGGIVGNCPAMQTLFGHIERMAPTESTVLVLGETGTGKELVARSIHQHSRRADKTLISVNCAAIPDTLIESELFGYEKGAFTGANASRMGLIEAADGGTLFLDEIGELPMEAQARLLRFIQEGEIRRIGSVHSRKVDVRLICATHRNLQQLSAEGQFRQDLYYRINVLCLPLPPLRERGKDILQLAESMLQRQVEKLGKQAMHLSPRAIQAITTYQWPGNVRELEHAIERAVILSDGDEIDNEALGIDLELVNINRLRGQDGISTGSTTPRNSSSEPQEDLSLEDYFQRFVLEHQDSMSETELAQKLGVSRKCLWERRQRFGIPRSKSSASGRRRKGSTQAG